MPSLFHAHVSGSGGSVKIVAGLRVHSDSGYDENRPGPSQSLTAFN